MTANVEWFESFSKTEIFNNFVKNPVAYFSAEYALIDSLPIYAGGLGVLSGDFVKEASDRGFPVVAVGIFYKEGYICKKINKEGQIIEECSFVSADNYNLDLLKDNNGESILIKIPIHDRDVWITVYEYVLNGNKVYLLDSDIKENDPKDRNITKRLYALDKETRFKQEMVLGIGGVRLLEKLGINPSVYHLNEGHSSMLILELVRHEMQSHRVSFYDAVNYAKRHIVFTNHTLVAAGNEIFSSDLVSMMLSKYAQEVQVPVHDIVRLGLVQDTSEYSMTMFSLRTSALINAVSRLHQEKAKDIWTDHPMHYVTNGIHIGTWDKSHDGNIVSCHKDNKNNLIKYIYDKTQVKFNDDELIIGWARRVVTYKRPLALFSDLERFINICRSKDFPLRVVISGFSPPGDKDGEMILENLQRLCTNELKDFVVYLPDYSVELSKIMVSGCDVWLNTPVVGYEACGTSGMKACLNGTLPFSTNDGWMAEVELKDFGFMIESDFISDSIYNSLEKDIIPTFYQNKNLWIEKMNNCRAMVLDSFSAARMLREYIEKMYLPVVNTIDH